MESTESPQTASASGLPVLRRNWWTVAIRGALAVLLGVLAFVWPGATLGGIVLAFGAFALVDGVFAFVGAVRAAENRRRWWPLALEGVAGVAAGVVAFLWPGLTAVALLYVVAAWAVVTGVLELAAAVRLRRELENEWLLALAGVLSIVVGVLLVVTPGGILALVWLIGAYALLFGASLLGLAWRLKRADAESESGADAGLGPGTA